MTHLLVLLAALAFALSPLLTPEFGGFDPNLYPVPQVDPPVQPAGYAFAIWGLIYLWLIVHAGFGLWQRRDDPAWAPSRVPLLISLAIGAGWLPVALVSPVWATLLIWAMLIAALMALLRAPAADRWWAEAPIGLYAGWLTAASCVSLGLLLAGWGWMSQVAAAWSALLIALAVSAAVQRAAPAPTYGLGVAWALVAVAVQNWGLQPTLVALALFGAGLMALLAALAGRRADA